MAEVTDVVVVGGGPAGSTAATMLARQGFNVVLVERERFPRDHVGESLLPASMPILEALGVSDAVADAGFLKKYGASMVWGADSQPWSWQFSETNRRYPHAYQVWRPQFDQILLENTRSSGVDVREGTAVTKVLFEGGVAAGVCADAPDGQATEIRASHIVDASGQAGLIGHNLKLRENDPGFRNLAIYGYWEGARSRPEPDATNIFIEAYEHGWMWAIPLHTGVMSVGAVVDSATGQAGIRASGAGNYYAAQVRGAQHTCEMLTEARLVEGPIVIRDWSYTSKKVAGPGYVLCGDAACFIDPLFSTGVHLALSSGLMAAAYVTTALRNPALKDAAAASYTRLYMRQYSQFRDLARLFYSSNRAVDSIFWDVRRLTGDEGRTPREAFVRATAGQSAQGYERVVLEHGALPDEFVEGVHSFEQEWQRRRTEVDALVASGAIMDAVPSLHDGAILQEQAVLGDGQFVPGLVLNIPGRSEETPLSGFVARIVELIDGQRDLAAIAAAVNPGADTDRLESIRGLAGNAASILYIDGAIARLEAPK